MLDTLMGRSALCNGRWKVEVLSVAERLTAPFQRELRDEGRIITKPAAALVIFSR